MYLRVYKNREHIHTHRRDVYAGDGSDVNSGKHGHLHRHDVHAPNIALNNTLTDIKGISVGIDSLTSIAQSEGISKGISKE
jgi:hypothetical protein